MSWQRVRNRRLMTTGSHPSTIEASSSRENHRPSTSESPNALLKLLEEPPAGSLFLLTTVEPRLLNEEGNPAFNVNFYVVNRRGESAITNRAGLWVISSHT